MYNIKKNEDNEIHSEWKEKEREQKKEEYRYARVYHCRHHRRDRAATITAAATHLTSNLTFVNVDLDNLYVFVDILIAHLLLLFKWYIHAHNSTSPRGIFFATRLQYDCTLVPFTSSRALKERTRARAKICTKWLEKNRNRHRAVNTSAVTASTAAAAAAASTLKYTRQRLSVEIH